LTSLVKAVDEKIAENSNLKAFVVQLTDTENEAETVTGLRALAADQGIKDVPLTLMDTPAGPPSYKIAEDAEVTVLLWRFTELRSKHSFGPGELTEADIERVLADLPKILDE
jgi:ABC-type sugar transport system substrate-binding protein